MKYINKYSFIIVIVLVFCFFIPKVIGTNSSQDKKEKEESSKSSDNYSSSSSISSKSNSSSNSSLIIESNPASSSDTSSKESQIVTSTDTSSKESKPTTVTNPDIGKFASEVGNFKKSDISYFDDALIIGDSRMVGLRNYGTIKNAGYYVNVGMSIYNIKKNAVDVNGEKLLFDDFIKRKQYKKIYITLGINESGYNREATVKQYKQLVDELLSIQKDAIIFINANLLVTQYKSQSDKYVHNQNIIQLNNMLAGLADGQRIFYIDVNKLFGDGNGNMKPEFTGDGTHIFAKYYATWCDWLLERTI